MSDYQPASFFLLDARGWTEWAIAVGELFAGKPSRYIHAGMITAADGSIVEAEPGGARKANIAEYGDQAVRICDGPVQRELRTYTANGGRFVGSYETALRARVVVKTLDLVDRPYSFLDYVALAALHLHLPSQAIRDRVASSGHLICSQLVDLAYAEADIHLYGGANARRPGDVMPADLSDWQDDWESGRL